MEGTWPVEILPSLPFPMSPLRHVPVTSGSKNGYQKRGKRRVREILFFFSSCPTPGPPQRDFPSAAAFEADLSWACFALNQSCPIWTCISHVPGALYPHPPSPWCLDVCSVPVQTHWGDVWGGEPWVFLFEGMGIPGIPAWASMGAQSWPWGSMLTSPSLDPSCPRISPITECRLLLSRECNEALKSTQAAKNNSNKNKDVIKARYDWSEVTASVTWLSQIPRTVGDRKGSREENFYLFKVLGPKLLTSQLW